MGHKTGVYRATFMINFIRGVTIGVIGTTSLTISGRSGVPQNNLIAARGLGLIIAPMLFGSAIGKLLRTGEVFRCISGALVVKAACELYLALQGSSAVLLCLALFSMGIAMGILDTAGGVVITMVHGQRCALPLNVIHALYGTGGMLAPLFALAAQERAWHVLALVDLLVAMGVTKTRLNRRLPRAGPQEGLASAGPAGGDTPAGPLADLEGSAPARVFGAGAAFLVLAQAAETAVSAWGFTFAVSHFGEPDAREVAAAQHRHTGRGHLPHVRDGPGVREAAREAGRPACGPVQHVRQFRQHAGHVGSWIGQPSPGRAGVDHVHGGLDGVPSRGLPLAAAAIRQAAGVGPSASVYVRVHTSGCSVLSTVCILYWWT